MTTSAAWSERAVARPRSLVRSVAIPSEHGGWGLTLEPVLLGLLVAPSLAGAALGAAALGTFLVRTPLKLVLVDRRRGRRLARTRVAARVATVELAVLGALLAAAALGADGPFWIPLALAAPLAAVQLGFDTRSRSRRMLPELAGTIAIASVVAAIVLADGGSGLLAAALWLVLSGRVAGTVPFVRHQIQRLHGRAGSEALVLGAQAVAVALAVGATVLERAVLAGGIALVVIAAYQALSLRRTPVPATRLGITQTVLGLMLVLATALGVLAS